MHELAVCQELMIQVVQIAAENHALSVDRVIVQAGALSGVEPPLLLRAFEIARAGTVAASADLEIRTGPVMVHCNACNKTSEATVNRLLCKSCGHWQVEVTEGEELLLLSLDLQRNPLPQSEPEPGELHHV